MSLAELLNKLCDLGIQKWDPALKPERKKTKVTLSRKIVEMGSTPRTAHLEEGEIGSGVLNPKPGVTSPT
ncbi:MAG: hypothetical protein K2X47_17335, partial [Bdellovibrionales bacterium]|nr:hypothetical protein [Bdellovibrionales bacterium]